MNQQSFNVHSLRVEMRQILNSNKHYPLLRFSGTSIELYPVPDIEKILDVLLLLTPIEFRPFVPKKNSKKHYLGMKQVEDVSDFKVGEYLMLKKSKSEKIEENLIARYISHEVIFF